MGSYTTPSRSVVSVNVVCISVVCVSVGPGDGHRTKVKSRRYDGELHYSIKKCGECQCGVCQCGVCQCGARSRSQVKGKVKAIRWGATLLHQEVW